MILVGHSALGHHSLSVSTVRMWLSPRVFTLRMVLAVAGALYTECLFTCPESTSVRPKLTPEQYTTTNQAFRGIVSVVAQAELANSDSREMPLAAKRAKGCQLRPDCLALAVTS